MQPRADLFGSLESLYAQTDFLVRLQRDPVRYVHRYTRPADQELAGLIAASMAFGRVDLFFPVLDRIFDWLDGRGGPRAAIEALDADAAHAALDDLIYRWIRGPDVVTLLAALQATLADHGSLSALAGQGSRDTLERLVQTVRGHAPEPWTRGFRYLLTAPSGGSACKRMNLFLRWMVRPPVEGVDVGIWAGPGVETLLIPVDTHVLRISRFLGLTTRSDTSWKTAVAITDALRAADPTDPVRFDFALAHLGISRACLGYRSEPVCAGCPLDGVCAAKPKT